VAELAALAVTAEAIFPKTVAFSLSEGLHKGTVDQLMVAVRELAFVSVGASSEL
jgi:hypothetical protein